MAKSLTILTNLLELELHCVRFYRVVAWKFLEMGRVKEAIPLLERILKMVPEEPLAYW